MTSLDLDLLKIKEMYLEKEFTALEIAKQMDCSKKTILRRLEKMGINRRKIFYSYNRKYFNKIDTPQKAYIFGFIFADGHLHKNKRSLQISIQERDRSILESFIKDIGGSIEQIKLKRKNCGQNQVRLEIKSKELCKDLNENGIPFGNKTFILQYPSIPKKLENHFIRGLIDGDGCFTATNINNKYPIQLRVEFMGTKDICNGILKYFGWDIKITSSDNVWRFSKVLSYADDIEKFYFQLYKDSGTFYLLRKKEKIEQILKERILYEKNK